MAGRIIRCELFVFTLGHWNMDAGWIRLRPMGYGVTARVDWLTEPRIIVSFS